MSKLITVYTQAYNVEKYMEQCIKSVMAQTYQNFEWILIENGSTDGTREIIRKYAQLDSRIKVDYFDENQDGFTNYYIQKNAKGDYIVKLDSDDWIEPDYLEKLIEPMEKQNADISICGALNYIEETGEETPHEYGELEGICQKQDIKTNFIEMRSYMGTYWGKMFRKDIFCKILPDIKAINEKLQKGNNYGGDMVFMLGYLSECNQMAFVKEKMYHYRLRNNSYAARTIGINRIVCYLALREIEKNFLYKVDAATNQNIILVELSFWEYIGRLMKHIIQQNLVTEKKMQLMSEVCSHPDIRQIRNEWYNSKVHAILAENIAWCYINMNDSDGGYLKDMLILLEPDVFGDISDEVYEWVRKDQILMAYIIMGEFLSAQEYIQQIATADNGYYIQELQKKLERTGKP